MRLPTMASDEAVRPRVTRVRRVAAVAAALVLGAFGARASGAAQITATPASQSVDVGNEVQVEISVVLGSGEVASIFESDFQLVGAGSIADVQLAAGGPSWPALQTEGNVAGGVASVSMTSSNTGGTRRVALLTVTGAGGGDFEVRLAPGAILQRDTASEPFFADVPLATAPGALLATVEVVPEPASAAAALVALAALARLGTRRR